MSEVLAQDMQQKYSEVQQKLNNDAQRYQNEKQELLEKIEMQKRAEDELKESLRVNMRKLVYDQDSKHDEEPIAALKNQNQALMKET